MAVREPTEATGARAFGQLLKELRNRIDIRQKDLAEKLGVHKSTLARIEAGTRNPPRDLWFYERLKQVKGISEFDVATLLRTDGAPAWLFRETVSPRDVLTPVEGVQIPLYVDPEVVSDEEYEVIKSEISLLITDLYRRKMERAERTAGD